MLNADEGLGLGFVARVRKTLDARANSIKGTVKDTKDMAKAQKPFIPGSIVSTHIANTRKANQELAPAIKELTT